MESNVLRSVSPNLVRVLGVECSNLQNPSIHSCPSEAAYSSTNDKGAHRWSGSTYSGSKFEYNDAGNVEPLGVALTIHLAPAEAVRESEIQLVYPLTKRELYLQHRQGTRRRAMRVCPRNQTG